MGGERTNPETQHPCFAGALSRTQGRYADKAKGTGTKGEGVVGHWVAL